MKLRSLVRRRWPSIRMHPVAPGRVAAPERDTPQEGVSTCIRLEHFTSPVIRNPKNVVAFYLCTARAIRHRCGGLLNSISSLPVALMATAAMVPSAPFFPLKHEFMRWRRARAGAERGAREAGFGPALVGP